MLHASICVYAIHAIATFQFLNVSIFFPFIVVISSNIFDRLCQFLLFFHCCSFLYSMDKFLLLFLLSVCRGGGVEGEMRQNNFYFDINVLFEAVDTVQKTFYHKNHIITNRSLTYTCTHTQIRVARACTPNTTWKIF